MEDRDTKALYLETTDRDAGAYASARVSEVLGESGVERATWWENTVRDRTDLPRVLPEFSVLGVYEVGATFDPPATPDDVTGHHFVRTPRPGQGCLTGRATIGLSLVLISPRAPEQARALRDWGDFVHIRHIAAAGVPGYSMITPYEHAGGGDPRFLHLYEIDRDDPEAVFQSMTPLVAKRFGGYNTPEYRAWAHTPELRIMYVNTFRLLGVSTAEPAGVTDFFAVVGNQRACRAFTDAPVPEAVIEQLLEAATHAPSAENSQPWVFVVVRDPETRSRIGAVTADAWTNVGREWSRDRLTPGVFADVDRGATGGVSEAPVLVVVAGDTTRCVATALDASIFPAIQNLLLAANAAGLGSALTTLPTFTGELSTILALPGHLRPVAVVPVGYPARRLGPPRRAPVAEKAHRERYGARW